MYSNFEIRKMKNTGRCRVCDRELNKDSDTVFATYSMRNRGQHIYICNTCLDVITGVWQSGEEGVFEV